MGIDIGKMVMGALKVFLFFFGIYFVFISVSIILNLLMWILV